jgi:hypothetical protein
MDDQPTKAAAAPPQPLPTRPDPYYGHENTAKLCSRFVTRLGLHVQSTPLHPRAQTHEAPVLHCLRFAPDKTTLMRDFRSSGLAAASESEVPYSSRFLGPSAVHLCVYDRLKSYLRRHIFEQVLVYSWAGESGCFSRARSIRWNVRCVIPWIGSSTSSCRS